MSVKTSLSKGAIFFFLGMLAVLAFCFYAIFFLTKDFRLDHYEFSYTSTQVVSNTSIETTVRECVSFDPTETSFDEVTQEFVKNHKVDGQLRVVNGCDSEIQEF